MQVNEIFLDTTLFVRTILGMWNGKDTVTDGITAGIEERKQRGLEIAALAKIEKVDGFWLVPSVTNPRSTVYRVKHGNNATCTCPDYETRGCSCKHIYAVRLVVRRLGYPPIDGIVWPDGEPVVEETITVTRKTYPQNWPAYNEAQTNEKRDFQRLLADLCRPIPTPVQEGKGQRRLPMSDAVFCAVFKVYCTLSARRFTSDLCDAQDKGYIEKVPHFNSVLNYLDDPQLTPILHSLIEQSSKPLACVETNFAVDSTGFTTCRFVRWYDVKYNQFTHQQQWVKAHLMCGVKTNVVTAVEIHDKDAADAPQLPALVDATAKNFTMKEVSADKGYSGQESHNAIAKHNAVPFIAFKSNATGGVGGLFGKMFHYFQFQSDAFLAHYHQRSNIESTVMMVKSKFGDSLRSKTDVAQKNETLAKILCHNISCLIHAIYELNIDPVFLPN